MNLNNILLPAGGALLGYLASGKDDSMKNAFIGAGVGFAANWFLKPAAPSAAQEDLPPQESLPSQPPQSGPSSGPAETPDETPPYEEPGYVPDDGESEEWVGKDPFPVGVIARFQSPFATSRTVMAVEAVKMSNGNWVTQPGQHVYWTSVGNMGRDPRAHVLDIVDPSRTKAYWQVGVDEDLSTYA